MAPYDSDADLIRICREHPAVVKAASGTDDNDPTWDAYDASRNAITDAKPQTLAGVIAKARIAGRGAQRRDGG